MRLHFGLLCVALLLGSAGCLSVSTYTNVDIEALVWFDVANAAANGNSSANLHIGLVRQGGKPLRDMQVTALIDQSEVLQGSTHTDAQGQLSATITSSQSGRHALVLTLVSGGFRAELRPERTFNFYTPAFDGRSVLAGDTLDVQAVARTEGQGPGIDLGYRGTVEVRCSDRAATLPDPYTFTAADRGIKVFSRAVILRTPGPQTVTVLDAQTGTVMGHELLFVVSPAQSGLILSNIPATTVAGEPVAFTLTFTNGRGEVDAGYLGTISFTSDDPIATRPPPYTFVASDRGSKTFTDMVMRTAGSKSLSAAGQGVGAQAVLQVTPSAPAALQLSAAATSVAGEPILLQVRAIDAFGNATQLLGGVVNIGSGDPQVSPLLPLALASDGTLQTNFVLRTAGYQSIFVEDGDKLFQAVHFVGVRPAPAKKFTLQGVQRDMHARRTFNLTVLAQDDFGNTDPSYTRLVHFSTSDSPPSVPPDYRFTLADAGKHVFSGVSFRNYGDHTLTVNDVVDSALAGTVGTHVWQVQDILTQANGSRACAILDAGLLKCWGLNSSGGLGLGDNINRGSTAAQMGSRLPFVDLGTGRTAFAAQVGNQRACALLDDAQVKCWGQNDLGQLGQGDTRNRGDVANEMGDALPAVRLGAGHTVNQISVGQNHTCVILDNGQVKCWGANNRGQLGQGHTSPRGASGAHMGDALSVVDLGSGRTAMRLASGYEHVCALLDDDTVKCWGNNVNGLLGLGDATARGGNPNQMGDALPGVNLGVGRVARALSANESHTCALLDNQQVKCWGENDDGQLGLGDNRHRGGGSGDMGDNLPSADLGVGRFALSVHTGQDFSCVLLDTQALKCWGQNDAGQLGLGHTSPRGTSPSHMGDGLPTVDLGTGRTVVQFSGGDHMGCAVLDDQQVKCWGTNYQGELGIGDGLPRGFIAGQMGDNLPEIVLW